jgi:G:T/U-mismatch repair DNA glycosylase
MSYHPFKPLIPKNSKKLLIGTLPPESADFYFSNSSNTRLWDILKSIFNNSIELAKGSNKLDKIEKEDLLLALGIGITDIILEYNRSEPNSTKDIHIIPIKYNDLLKIAIDNDIDELLFIYASAYKWFVHSLTQEEPAMLSKLKGNYQIGLQEPIKIGDKIIKCTILPAPLNRGRKGQSLNFKLDYYKSAISNH